MTFHQLNTSILYTLTTLIVLACKPVPKVPASKAVSSISSTTMPGSRPYPSTSSYTVGGVEFVFSSIPSGKFTMGLANPDTMATTESIEPLHDVTLLHSYMMLTKEITRGQYRAIMGNYPEIANPTSGCLPTVSEDSHPVTCVSWEDAQDFVAALNRQSTGSTNPYSLPTEAQWERAARGGTSGYFSKYDQTYQTTTDPGTGQTTQSDTPTRIPLNELDIAWYNNNASGQTHSGGQKEWNPYGLYDVHGNVWEWVRDTYSGLSNQESQDPIIERETGNKVIRGGAFNSSETQCRSAYRGNKSKEMRQNNIGFRIIRKI